MVPSVWSSARQEVASPARRLAVQPEKTYGAGKTTTVRVLTTLIQPDAGRPEVAGFDVAAQPQPVRARIGVTGQSATIGALPCSREFFRTAQRPAPAGVWSLQPVVTTLGMIAVLLAVVVPLSVRRYARMAR